MTGGSWRAPQGPARSSWNVERLLANAAPSRRRFVTERPAATGAVVVELDELIRRARLAAAAGSPR